jgi:hypothetical protein
MHEFKENMTKILNCKKWNNIRLKFKELEIKVLKGKKRKEKKRKEKKDHPYSDQNAQDNLPD